MHTAFEQSDETALILAVAGNVENKTVANYGDDGVSQKATITKGIAGKEDVIVPNPVTLRPYRTFLEVEQPESKFIFRIREDSDGQPMFKLVEADGGLWKYEAVDAIKKYLTVSLPEELLKVITIIGQQLWRQLDLQSLVHRKEKPGRELSMVKVVEHSHILQNRQCYMRI